MNIENGFAKMWSVSIALLMFLLVGCHEPGSQRVAGTHNEANTAPKAPNAAIETTAAGLTAYTPSAAMTPLTTCNLEQFDDAKFQGPAVTAATGSAHSVAGWIAAPAIKDSQYWLRFDDKQAARFLQARLTLNVQRPDVAASVAGAPALSGFKFGLPANVLPAGHYHVYLAVVGNGMDHVCDNGRQVNFGP